MSLTTGKMICHSALDMTQRLPRPSVSLIRALFRSGIVDLALKAAGLVCRFTPHTVHRSAMSALATKHYYRSTPI